MPEDERTTVMLAGPPLTAADVGKVLTVAEGDDDGEYVVVAAEAEAGEDGPGGSTPNLLDVLLEGNDAGNNRIIGLPDPTDPQEPATKAYVDDNPPTIAAVLGAGNNAEGEHLANVGNFEATGDLSFSGALQEDLDAGGNSITNLNDPTADQHAATKKYVDDNAGGAGLTNPLTETLDTGGNNITSPGNGYEVNGDLYLTIRSDSGGVEVNAAQILTLLGSSIVIASGLPTSDPVVAGQLWNSAGTLKVSAGP